MKILKTTIFILFIVSINIIAKNIVLNDLIQNMYKTNLELKSLQEKIYETDFDKSIAKTEFGPKLDGSFTYIRNQDEKYFEMQLPGPGGTLITQKSVIMPINQYVYNVSISQPLFMGFKVMSNFKIKSLNAEIQRIKYKIKKRELTLQTIQNYYNLIKLIKLKDISAESIKQMEAHLENIRNFYNAGTVSRNDVLKAEVQLDNIKLQNIQLRHQAHIITNVLNHLTGMKIKIDDKFNFDVQIKNIKQNLNYFIDKALKERMEIKTFEFNKDMLEYALKINMGNFLPTAALQGSYQEQRPADDFTNNDPGEWKIMLNISLNIFNFGKNWYELKKTQSQIKQLDLSLQQIKKGIKLEIQQDYLSVQENLKKIDAAEKTTQQAEESYRIAENQVKQNMITNTEFLDSQLSLMRSKSGYQNAIIDYKLSRIKLLYDIGEDNF